MNPNGVGENNLPGQGSTAVIEPVAPVIPSTEPQVNTGTNPLSGLENAVADLQKNQFTNQFGSPQVAQLDPSINTVNDLLAQGPQVVEVEKTPADELKDKISAAVDNFLEQVTKEKVAA